MRQNRQGAINRAFGAFALACLGCLVLPLLLLDPLLPSWPDLALLWYGFCYLFAPAAFMPLPLTIYWPNWRRDHAALYRFVQLAPIGLALLLFGVLLLSAPMGEPTVHGIGQVLIVPALDYTIRYGFGSLMLLGCAALLLPRALRSVTGVERRSAVLLIVVVVLTEICAWLPWPLSFGAVPLASTLVSVVLTIRLLVCYDLLMRYRLFSRASVGVDLALQRMTDGFILLDELLRVQAFNPSAAVLLPEMARGAPLPRLDTDVAVSLLAPQEQFARMQVDGRVLNLSWSPISDRRGVVRGAVMLLRDITEHEALTATLAEIDMLQQLNSFKADVIGSLRHELRTPLTAILGYSGALLVHEADQERRDFLEIIRRETKRLTRMIEDFLDMSSIQAGHMRYDIRDIDLADRFPLLAERFVETHSTHPLIFNIQAGLPSVYADAERVDQVLSNLVSNAIKYSPEGGPIWISVASWDRPAPEWSAQSGGWVRVTVRDQGLGLPPEAIDQIFDRFYRVQDDARYTIRGTGLGLSICKEIVQALNGCIWAESPGIGKGSTFCFTLPIAAERQAEIAA